MNKFMQLAIKEAKKGIQHGYGGPFGAVVVRNGKVIGRGHNQVIKNNDPTCHGEIMAIKAACKKIKKFDLTGCELYTTGEPCPMCYGAILWSNIEAVYYGCNIIDTDIIGFRDNNFYKRMDLASRKEIMSELDRSECLKLYKEYAAIEDKKEY